ncbi:MAG: hypothetical protein FD165_2271 [Gammaproteobacteria bacterium]|nr:MAG: hypothetical protein FD165_2271 [Gammaproteobacteria bacterium]TND02653.1 MAG: hypothetical protein FD120_2114 [Gammaproteobacteria bacterium]
MKLLYSTFDKIVFRSASNVTGGNGEIFLNERPHPAPAAAGGHRVHSERVAAALLLLAILFACGVGATEPESGPDGRTETFRLTTVYAAGMATVPTFRRALGYTMHHGGDVTTADKSNGHDKHADQPGARLPRPWIPVDLSVAPNGELWLIQRLQQSPDFDDMSECPVDAKRPADCEALLGSTVTLRQPQAAKAASVANGRATLVIDYNAWHFMRRPSAIAFGAAQVWLEPNDPGAMHDKRRLLDKRVAFKNTFATCAEHRTANFSDQPFFIGPTLWTADPAIYNGTKGAYDWSNGAHLDMVHGTAYCMGIAFERDTRYWTFNGNFGALDLYDFGAPHFPGHYYHNNATVTRYRFGDNALTRLPNVPSNMVLVGNDLFIADSGNGRLVAFDTAAKGRFAEFHFSLPPELQRIQVLEGVPLRDIASRQTLGKLWGEEVAPSGLALLNKQTLALANHASGHITLLDLDGKVLRTIDTGLGKGIGGMTALGGALYFAHMVTRKVYRLEIK